VSAYTRPVATAASWLGLGQVAVGHLMAAVLIVAAAAGAVGGACSWRVAGRVVQRLGAAS
jgi:hypothetical protein